MKKWPGHYLISLIKLLKMRKVASAALVILLIFCMGGILSMCRKPKSEKNPELSDLLPGAILGWLPSEPDRIFDPDTIFDYIDGAGEVYRAYRFKGLLGRRYAREGQPDIIADLFDMGRPENAFGVFTHDPEGEKVDVGQDAVYKGGLLSFWKGRFFASIFSEEETPEARKAVLALGKTVASSITEEGEKPELVGLFPEKNRAAGSVRFFFSPIILNYHFYVADENIFSLGETTEAAIAIYALDGRKTRLLLIRYGGEAAAANAATHFKQTYMPEAADTGSVQTEDGTWTMIQIRRRFLAVVFEAPSKDSARTLLNDFYKQFQ